LLVAAHAAPVPAGWLGDRSFDLHFIVGAALLAIASGALVVADLRWFALLLLLSTGYWQWFHYTRQSYGVEQVYRRKCISTSVYLLIDHTVGSLAVALVVYQTINFHHYLVDGLIWKVRRRRLQETLGLEEAA
jgi:hypothetical protein